MATVTKDFKVKSGLIVEGATATVNNHDILTKKQDDQDYIVNLIGGTATSLNTPDSVVKRDSSGNFAAGSVTADLVGNVTGNVVGNVTGDVTGNVTGTVSTLSNHDTDDLAEGTNLYFTNARAQSAVAADIATAKSEAISDAADDATTKANAAEVSAKAYADGLAINYDTAGAAASALTSANSYTDTAVAGLVDSAPALLDTLNELAAAIGDNPSYATDVANLVSTKADTTYVDSQDSATLSSANSYADGLAVNYDPAGAAATAETNAETYASGLVGQEVIDRDAAISTAINALDTDDIEEGLGNLYFTSERAVAAVGGTIGDAINALTTDDIEEGSSNLYFTDSRAVSALQAVTPQFQEVDIAWVTRQSAGYTWVPNASIANVFEWPANYASAKFLVRVRSGNHSQVSEVLVTADNSNNVALTEYAIVGTNGNLGNVSATYDGTSGTYKLTVETTENNSEVIVSATLMVYGD